MNLLKKLKCMFFRDPYPKQKRNENKTGKTHNYTVRGWGHDFIFTPIDGGERGDMMGWGNGIEVGDFLLLPNNGSSSRYKVTSIKYLGDPPDMWSAKVIFAPRSRNEF